MLSLYLSCINSVDVLICMHTCNTCNVLTGSMVYVPENVYISTSIVGFSHSTVNHDKNFKDPVTGTHSNTIEGRLSVIISLLLYI